MAIQGLDVDGASRCRHWHGPLDVVAFRFACCGWWACRDCHDALADHPAVRPTVDDAELAVRCGACGHTMAPQAYLDAVAAGDLCPDCGHAWNPGCRAHHGLYFAPAEHGHGRAPVGDAGSSVSDAGRPVSGRERPGGDTGPPPQ